jgi:HIV Tat-specific factor 1
VRIFASNPEGVVTVRFGAEETADKCVELMNGRFFAGRRLEAGKYDGRSNFNVGKVAETEEEQAARLERFAAELEAGADAAEAAAAAAGLAVPPAGQAPAAAVPSKAPAEGSAD